MGLISPFARSRFCYNDRIPGFAARYFQDSHLHGAFEMKRTVFLLVASATLVTTTASAASLELKKGDHICLIGNTLADRMQHDGWLETYLHSRFPKHNLVFRNLGFSGDELTVRLRSASFGTPRPLADRHQGRRRLRLLRLQRIVRRRRPACDKFKKDLDDFIKHTLSQKYNGKTPPRLVLFSPIAHENLQRPQPARRQREQQAPRALHHRDGRGRQGQQRRLRRSVPADAGSSTRKASQPLTINGIHLTEHGNDSLAEVIDKALFADGRDTKRDAEALEKLRQAVLDKNFYWFNRYRTVDGYSIYGGRADLRFVDGQTNRDVTQREMEVLDVMTANRDKRDLGRRPGRAISRSTTATRRRSSPSRPTSPARGPSGKHIFLDGEEAIKKMTVAKGMKVNLFASEKEFPELAKPVQMTFDAKGRLWVAVWPSYPHWKPKEPMNDKILILEDTKGDGKADKMHRLRRQPALPDRLRVLQRRRARRPGARPDVPQGHQRRRQGRHRACACCTASTRPTRTTRPTASRSIPAAALYFQEGTFHHTQVETPYGPPRALRQRRRLPLRAADAEVRGLRHLRLRQSARPRLRPLGPGHRHRRHRRRSVSRRAVLRPSRLPAEARPAAAGLQQQRTRPCPGIEILSSRHFPAAMQGNLLVANVIGFQGILQYKLEDKGSSFAGTEHRADPVLDRSELPPVRPARSAPTARSTSSTGRTRSSATCSTTSAIRAATATHGRIYRVTYEGRPLLKPAKIAGEPIEKLLDLLKEPEDRVRYRAAHRAGRPRQRRGDRRRQEVDRRRSIQERPEYEHHLLEALWLHQNHNVVNVDLLKRMLASPDFRARAAATRVLCYWRDRVPDALELLQASWPPIRIRACGWRRSGPPASSPCPRPSKCR